jgi:hypothetical protein
MENFSMIWKPLQENMLKIHGKIFEVLVNQQEPTVARLTVSMFNNTVTNIFISPCVTFP